MKRNMADRLRLKQADQLFQAQKFAAACDIYRQLSLVAPEEPGIWLRLSAACKALGDFAQSRQALRRLTALEPNNGYAWNELGLISLQLTQPAQAIDAFLKALPLAPDPAVVQMNLGQTYLLMGDAAQALGAFENVLKRNPQQLDALIQSSAALNLLGRHADAMAAADRALQRQPAAIDAWIGKAEALTELARIRDAMACYAQAVLHVPDAVAVQQRIANLCRVIHCDTADVPHYQSIMAHLYDWKHIDFQTVSRFAISFFKVQDDFLATLRETAQAPDPITGIAALSARWPSFFAGLLCHSILEDGELECRLIDLRRRLLTFFDAQPQPATVPVELEPVLHGLASQCFLNEYVWFVSEAEEAMLERLASHLSAQQAASPLDHPLSLYLLGMYQPLYQFDGLAGITETNTAAASPSLRQLLQQQLFEPRQEAALKSQLTSLTAIEADTSGQVRAQYEENPYPRWLNMARVDPRHKQQAVRALLADSPARGYLDQDIDMLVAGCGTGRQAILAALNFPQARVTAIDLSRTSLAYAWRKTQEMGIRNIVYQHGDIMALDALDRSFHIIESTGVLHHLQDPAAGWEILCRKLMPHGLMHIALYSQIARQTLDVAREQVPDTRQVTPSVIRSFRKEVLAAAPASALGQLALTGQDFYSLSACRDLLFHVREHRFTLPALQALMQTLGLKFLGFELNPATIAAYSQFNPADPKGLDLQAWHAFETEHPLTFAGMYQFWCEKI